MDMSKHFQYTNILSIDIFTPSQRVLPPGKYAVSTELSNTPSDQGSMQLLQAAGCSSGAFTTCLVALVARPACPTASALWHAVRMTHSNALAQYEIAPVTPWPTTHQCVLFTQGIEDLRIRGRSFHQHSRVPFGYLQKVSGPAGLSDQQKRVRFGAAKEMGQAAFRKTKHCYTSS